MSETVSKALNHRGSDLCQLAGALNSQHHTGGGGHCRCSGYHRTTCNLLQNCIDAILRWCNVVQCCIEVSPMFRLTCRQPDRVLLRLHAGGQSDMNEGKYITVVIR
jgi:hypothetical protein